MRRIELFVFCGCVVRAVKDRVEDAIVLGGQGE